jgi:hypothetical protein
MLVPGRVRHSERINKDGFRSWKFPRVLKPEKNLRYEKELPE